jgi:hypothetical protein
MCLIAPQRRPLFICALSSKTEALHLGASKNYAEQQLGDGSVKALTD